MFFEACNPEKMMQILDLNDVKLGNIKFDPE